MTTNRRNTGIDMLRIIGLAVIVMLHAGLSDYCKGCIIFAIPLFYLVAGYLYRDYSSLRELLSVKFRRLIIPFLFFALCGLLIYIIGNCLLLNQPLNGDLFNLLSLDRYYLPYPAALWFFESIFWCYMLFGAIRRLTHHNIATGLLCLTIGIGGWILSRHAPLPLCFDTAMSWMPLFYIGYSLKLNKFGASIMDGKYWIWGVAATIASCSAYLALGYTTGYCYNVFVGNIPAIIILTTIATLGVTALCCRVKNVPFISKVGRNSLVIFAGHQHFIIIIEQSARLLNISQESDIFNLIKMMLSICACWIAAIILRRYAPWLIGEDTRRQQSKR